MVEEEKEESYQMHSIFKRSAQLAVAWRRRGPASWVQRGPSPRGLLHNDENYTPALITLLPYKVQQTGFTYCLVQGGSGMFCISGRGSVEVALLAFTLQIPKKLLLL